MIRFCCNCKPILCVNAVSQRYYFCCGRCNRHGPQNPDLEHARRLWNKMEKKPVLISRYGIPRLKSQVQFSSPLSKKSGAYAVLHPTRSRWSGLRVQVDKKIAAESEQKNKIF